MAKHRTCSPEVLDDEFGAPNGQIVEYKTGHFVVEHSENEHNLGANSARFELQIKSASKTMQNAYEINAEQDTVDQSVVLAQGSMTHVSCDYNFHHSSSAKQSNMEHGETHCEESRPRRHKVEGVTSISVQLCLAAVRQLWSARMEGWFLSGEL